MASGAMAASSIYLCVDETSGGGVKSGGTSSGSCKAGYDQVALPAEEKEQQTLLSILPYIKYEEKGIDSKPTIELSGANVQIISGAGKEEAVNGEGNLIVGYDETPGTQTGSDNLLLGSKQTYESYGALIAGIENTSKGPFSDVFGFDNVVSGDLGSSVSGGNENSSTGFATAVSGGEGNAATASDASVSGGVFNTAGALFSWVGGGEENETQQPESTISGGHHNRASGYYTSVNGGYGNNAKGQGSSILGGKEVTVSGEYEEGY